MSLRQIDVHPEAVAEARAAAQWYRERSPLAADAFLKCGERDNVGSNAT